VIVNSSKPDQRTFGETIQMKMTAGDSHHQEEVEESRPPQVQQDKGHTIRDEMKARIKAKVQLVVLTSKMVMVSGETHPIMDKRKVRAWQGE
jgi:hypothetical protein